MTPAFDPSDIQIGVEPYVFLRQASFPANGFQSLHNLLHKQFITPLSFHIANNRNNALNFYYTFVVIAIFRHSIRFKRPKELRISKRSEQKTRKTMRPSDNIRQVSGNEKGRDQ